MLKLSQEQVNKVTAFLTDTIREKGFKKKFKLDFEYSNHKGINCLDIILKFEEARVEILSLNFLQKLSEIVGTDQIFVESDHDYYDGFLCSMEHYIYCENFKSLYCKGVS